MKGFRLYISKFIVAILAAQILNLSIDIQNFQPPEPTNMLCYINEMNSVVELVTEKLITKKDTFPENDHHNNGDSQSNKHTSISTFFPAERFAEKIDVADRITHNSFLPVTYNFIYREILSPPPKSC